jgi:hypothetical protein
MTSAIEFQGPDGMNNPTASRPEFGAWSMGFEAMEAFFGKERSVI